MYWQEQEEIHIRFPNMLITISWATGKLHANSKRTALPLTSTMA